MRSLATILFCASALGCAEGGLFGGAGPASVAADPNRDRPLTYYHAYGDSITSGYLLPDAATQAYPALVAAAKMLPLANYAAGGDMACDLPTVQIFPNGDVPTLVRKGLYTVLISTTDVSARGAGAYEAIFNLCHQASVSWLAIPAEFKLLATSPAVIPAGPTHVEGAPFAAVWTDAADASLTFPVQLAVSGPVYIWYRIADGNAGTFSIELDGKAVAQATTATTPRLETYNQRKNSLALLRLAKVGAGVHSVVLTQTSPGSSGLGVVAVGVPPPSPPSTMPRVLVGTTPRQLAGGSGVCALDDSPCQAYIKDITANVALLAADGLNVQLFDSRRYMTGTSADIADSGGHTNALGNQEIFRAIEDVLQ